MTDLQLMTLDPLNSTAYVVTVAVLFGGGYAAFRGALWWQGYGDDARHEVTGGPDR